MPRVVATGRRRRDVTDDSDDEDDEEEGGGGEWIILAGCAGGIVREWPASDLSNSSSGGEDEKNDASARLLLPRRSFRSGGLTGRMMGDVVCLASPSHSSFEGSSPPPPPPSDDDDNVRPGAVVYGLMDGWMVRFVVPPFFARSSSTGSGGVSRGTTVPLVATRLAFAGGAEDAAGGRHRRR